MYRVSTGVIARHAPGLLHFTDSEITPRYLRALAARDLRYLGLIGSRAKVARLFDALRAEGLPAECLRRVHAPVGLDIGAVTPAEIAVSILAEIIAVRRGKLTGEGPAEPVDRLSMRYAPRSLTPEP